MVRCGHLFAVLTVGTLSCLVVCPSQAAETATLKYLTRDGRSVIETPRVISSTGRIALFRTVSPAARQLIVMDLQSGEETPVDEPGIPGNPAWSPDGTVLAYTWRSAQPGLQENTLRLWRGGQRAGRILAGGADGYSEFAWSPDGRRLAVRKHTPDWKRVRVSIFDVRARKEVEVNPAHLDSGTYQSAGSWRPDSAAFCFPAREVKEGPYGVWVCKADGSQLRRVTPPECTVDKVHWQKDGAWIAFGAHYQRAEGESWERDIWLVKPSGRGLHRVTQGASTDWKRRNSYGLYTCTPEEGYAIVRWYFPDFGRHRADRPAGGWAYVDLKTGEVIPAVATDISGSVRDTESPYWEMSPDGYRFFCRWGESEIRDLTAEKETPGATWQVAHVFDVRTRTDVEVLRIRTDTGSLRFVGWPSFSPDGKRVYFTLEKVIPGSEVTLESDVCYLDL